LQADSKKGAFYDISIVENTGDYFVVKRSGIAEDKVLDQRQWHFSDYEKADKMFKNKIGVQLHNFTPEQLRNLQLKGLEMLIYFKEFCDENNLLFYLCGAQRF